MSRVRFWGNALRSFGTNLSYCWPLFLLLAGWLFAAAAVLQAAEGWPGYWQAVWTTWTTMATEGWGEKTPLTVLGKLVISLDAFVGIVLIGAVVWLVTTSLSER
jgi:hypothetical protein